MKSKKAQYEIKVTKMVNQGHMPLFVSLAHQGLTKSQPTPVSGFGTSQTFLIPKDTISISVPNKEELYADIESIEFTYDTKKA